MRTVLAFEPDARQAAALTRVVRDQADADIIVVETKDAALDAIRARIPDLILLTAFISPRDEGEIADLIRETDGAEHTQSLTIPMLAVGPSRPARKKKRGLLSALTGESAEPQSPAGCDPAVFAEEIVNYLQQAEHRKAEAAARKARSPKKPRRKKRDAEEPVAAAPAETGGSSSYWSWDAPAEPQADAAAVDVDAAPLIAPPSASAPRVEASTEPVAATEGDTQGPGSTWANPWGVSEPSVLKPEAPAQDAYLDDIIIRGPEPFFTTGAETVQALLEQPAPVSAADQLAETASVRAEFLRPDPHPSAVAEPAAGPSAALRQFESAGDRADDLAEERDSPPVDESEIVAVRLPTRADSATLLALQADVARLRQQRETTDATLLAAKATQERAARAASEAAAQARREADRRAEESAARAKEEAIAERKAREAAEKRAAEEAERRAEAERLAREQAEQRIEAERMKARADAERKAKLEADARVEAERRKAREEAERLAREQAEQRIEAERRKAREEAERLAREQAEQRIEAERRKAREEAERLAREQAEQRVKAERRAREEAERRAEAERLAREEAERRAKEETARLEREARERRAHADAERKAREAAEAHAAAERKAREIAERSAREQAERLARDAAREAVRKTQEEADQQARRTAAETDRMHKAAQARAREEAAAERHARQLAEQRALEERKAREESERRAANDRAAREQAELAAEAARAEAASKPKKAGANRKSKKAAKPEPAAKVRKRREPARSVQDEWGLYDPNAAGFEALFAKLESIENGEEERPAAARPMPRPLAMWAFQFNAEPAPVAAPASKGHDEFRALISQFSIPHAVASVSYAKGARIRQIDVRELPRGAGEPDAQVVVLSRRLLKEVRRQTSAEVASVRR